MKINYREHNQYIANLPQFREGRNLPVIISEWFADRIVESGQWKEYKDSVYVQPKLKTN